MRILLVDDDANMCELFRRVMDGIISRAVETPTLAGALKAVETESFDVVLLDLRLLDTDHNATIERIPELKRKSGASIVVVTGVLEPNIEGRLLRNGADFVVLKGTEFSSLRKALLLAVHSAVCKNPRKHPGDDYMAHVQLLERLVHAA